MKALFTAATMVVAMNVSVASAEPDSCQKVKLADLGWTDLTLTNTTASLLLKSLGYQPTQTLLGLNVAYEALKTKQMDVFLGNWRPAQDIEFKGYFDAHYVEPLSVNLTGAKFTLAVPTYVADAGVKSYDDLAKHADKFGSTIYGIEAGSNKPLLDMIAANRHGLKGWNVIESSEAGMLTQVARTTKNNGWIVFLAWEPHPMNLNYKLTYLSGGDVEYGPDFGGATVHTITRPGYAKECPNVAKLLTNLKFNLSYENNGMNAIMTNGKEPTEAAKELMAKRPELLKEWLAGVVTRDGKDGYEAAKAALLTK